MILVGAIWAQKQKERNFFISSSLNELASLDVARLFPLLPDVFTWMGAFWAPEMLGC